MSDFDKHIKAADQTADVNREADQTKKRGSIDRAPEAGRRFDKKMLEAIGSQNITHQWKPEDGADVQSARKQPEEEAKPLEEERAQEEMPQEAAAAAETSPAKECGDDEDQPSDHHGRKRPHGKRGRKKEKDEFEDLEFISEETVKDKSKMASGNPIHGELISKKKTHRRSVDEQEAKKERSVTFLRKNVSMLILLVAVIVVAIVVLTVTLKEKNAKKAEEAANRALSAQEYEVDENEAINTLIENYFDAYAAGATDEILLYAKPMTDKEKSYIQTYSQFVAGYENIVCYTKSGADDTSYIVSVAFDLKYKGVDKSAPGLDFFYVRTDESGDLYIDNVYSTFNMVYQENATDPEILALIDTYKTGDDVVSLQAGVETNYSNALQDEALQAKVNEVNAAMEEWQKQQEEAEAKAQEEAQQQVASENTEQTQDNTENTDGNDQPDQTDQADQTEQNTDGATENTDAVAQEPTETESFMWVYATDGVMIRESPDANSAALASVNAGAQLRQQAVRSDGWTKVQTGDILGYVKSEYLTTTQP